MGTMVLGAAANIIKFSGPAVPATPHFELATRVRGREREGEAMSIVCLFVCLFHGVAVVCGGHRLSKDGTYATNFATCGCDLPRNDCTPC